MPKKIFKNVKELCMLVDDYFDTIAGEYRLEEKPAKKPEEPPVTQKVTIREAEPPTMAGLALHLGFNSREEFDMLEKTGKYAPTLKRARLRIEVAYEKKLHQQSPSGALFALKSMGWSDKPEDRQQPVNATIAIKLIERGPQPVSNEKEVVL